MPEKASFFEGRYIHPVVLASNRLTSRLIFGRYLPKEDSPALNPGIFAFLTFPRTATTSDYL
jgi:hypothetical protein